MKKKTAIVSMFLILSMIMTGCSWSSFVNKLPWSKSNSVSEYDPEEYITFSDYKGVEVDVSVSEQEIQTELDTLLKSNQETKAVTRKVAKNGDVVKIDYTGTVNKKKFDGGTKKGDELELGSNSMIPGFESGIVGMKVGQTKNIKVTFPADYSEKSLQGKKANFKIKLHSISEKITPEATDANIAKFTENKTLTEYKTATKQKLMQNKKDDVNSTAYKNYVNSVTMENPPEVLLQKYKDYYDKYWKSYLTYYGYDFDTFLTSSNMTEDQYKEQLVTIATDLTKNYLVIRYIMDKEGIIITDADKEAHIQELIKQYSVENKEALATQIKDYYGLELDEYVVDTFYEKKATEIVGTNAKLKEE